MAQRHTAALRLLRGKRIRGALLCALPVLCAATNMGSLPALLEADDLYYDQNRALVIARGNVEIIQGERMLLADRLTYDNKTDRITAEGRISLLEPSGDVFFAHKAELRDNLKTGVVQDFRARLKDGSLVAANQGQRVNEHVTKMEDAVYSPCPVKCTMDAKEGKPPQWQLRARKVTLDSEKQRMYYKHAFFDVAGMPVFYTPYFSHPAPGADRKSGFLVPSYSNQSTLGTVVRTPFYYNLAPNMDATFTPIFTSEEGTVLHSEYRHMVPSGTYRLRGSITNPDEISDTGQRLSGRELRGHIEGEGEFGRPEDWQWGFNGKRSTDDTYLRRYGFGGEDYLTTRAYVQQIEGRNYTIAETLSFQGLRPDDDPGLTPLVLPRIDMHQEMPAGFWHSRFVLDANATAVARDEGTQSRRLSAATGWEVPLTTPGGQVLSFKASLRGDGYSVDDVQEVPQDSTSRTLDGFAGRVVPQAELSWRLPLVRRGPSRNIFLEPIAAVAVSPYGGNPDKIPNEDSQDVEFSDENLFDSNRFTGLDRIENGPRVNYGLRGGIHDRQYGQVNYLFGQSYHTHEDKNFTIKSGLNEHFSDYVGRIGYKTNEVFDVAYRFRVDKEEMTVHRSDVTARVDYAPFDASVDYLMLDENFSSSSTAADRREAATGTVGVWLNPEWRLSVAGHRNLDEGKWISTGTDLTYQGDCTSVIFGWKRDFTRDRDIEPSTSFLVQVVLKGLN